MHVDDVHDRRGPAREADADARGEDLGERVEAEHAPDLREHARLERKVRRRARGGAEVEVVVGVVLEDEEVVLVREREDLEGFDKAADARLKGRLAEQKRLVDSQAMLAANLNNAGPGGGGGGGGGRPPGFVRELAFE